MKKTTSGWRNETLWTLTEQLKDLDYADGLALLADTHFQMQVKTTQLETMSAKVGLIITSTPKRKRS